MSIQQYINQNWGDTSKWDQTLFDALQFIANPSGSEEMALKIIGELVEIRAVLAEIGKCRVESLNSSSK